VWHLLEQREVRRLARRRAGAPPRPLPRPDRPAGTDLLPQIRHIVVLMMENHSYDNYLGMLQGRGEGFPRRRGGQPKVSNRGADGKALRAFHLPSTVQHLGVPSQSWHASHLQWGDGQCDGFVTSAQQVQSQASAGTAGEEVDTAPDAALILGIIVGVGELVTRHGNGNVLGDRTVPHWLASHRTPGLTRWSLILTAAGGTQAILIVSLATCVVFLAVTRRWRPVIYIATLLAGQLGAFLVAEAVVRRPRPAVTHLDHHLPTSAYPSGHEAATCCLYIAVAILVIGHARGWWRWLSLIPAIAMPVLVALSRIYRGEHHPTDVLGSLLFSALWLAAATALIKPNADTSRPSGKRPRPMPLRGVPVPDRKYP